MPEPTEHSTDAHEAISRELVRVTIGGQATAGDRMELRVDWAARLVVAIRPLFEAVAESLPAIRAAVTVMTRELNTGKQKRSRWRLTPTEKETS